MTANYNQPDYIDKRVRYYDGQFLKDQDLIDEQKYHVDRERRLSRILQVSGISEGLGVIALGSDRVSVSPGTAVDSKGRLIVLAAAQEISVASYRSRTVSLFISYQKIESDLAEDGSDSNRRWHEKPLLQAVLEGETVPPDAIILAKLNVAPDGIVAIDNSVRQYSGLSLPSAGGKGPSLRSGGDSASNRAILTGDLSVSGRLDVDNLAIASPGSLSFGETTRQMINLWQQLYGIGVQNDTQYFRTLKNFAWYKGGSHNNTALDAGGGSVQMAINDGNVGIGTASPQAKLDVQGTIKSPMWRVTQLLVDRATSPLPLTTTSFTSGGGTLLLLFSGGAFSSVAARFIGYKFKVDASEVGTIRRFSNEVNTHKTLSGSLVVPSIAAGSHTITLEKATTETTADVNTIGYLTVCELPF